jgi:hypothetical protein
MGRMRTALDQGLAFERHQYPVHRLGGGVAGPREIGARCAALAREHAQHPVLRCGQAVRAQGHVHGAAKRLPGLAQEVAAVPLDAAVALPDPRNAHRGTEYQVLDKV